MKYKLDSLFFAKCRHYVMDIINVTDDSGNIISPHPDYIDYYTILLLKNKKYVNIYNKGIRYKHPTMQKEEITYDKDIILETSSLLEYVDKKHKKISERECELVDEAIQKTKSYKIEYGYKNSQEQN
jgi:hypothetical protein